MLGGGEKTLEGTLKTVLQNNEIVKGIKQKMDGNTEVGNQHEDNKTTFWGSF